jgi:hypothetical protein
VAAGASDYFALPLPLKPGDRVSSVSYHYDRDSGSPTFKLFRLDMATGTRTQVGTTITGTGTTYTTTTDSGINHTVLSGNSYFIEWVGAASGNRFYGVTVNYVG